MTDYKYRIRRPGTSKEDVGVRELKTHAARIVRQVREEQASYVITHRGRPVGVILPIDPDSEEMRPENESADAAWRTFLRVGRRLESHFKPGASGVHALAAMRR